MERDESDMENVPLQIPQKSIFSTRRGAIIFSVSVLAGLLAVKLCFPMIVGIMARVIPPCLLNILGLNCPLCGGTHCAAALAMGDLAKAWYYNPYVVLGTVYLAAAYLKVVISCFAKKYRPVKLLISTIPFGWAVLALTVVFAVVRNLPFYRAVFY